MWSAAGEEANDASIATTAGRLADKTKVIAGAARGSGRATDLRFVVGAQRSASTTARQLPGPAWRPSCATAGAVAADLSRAADLRRIKEGAVQADLRIGVPIANASVMPEAGRAGVTAELQAGSGEVSVTGQ